MAAYLDDKGQKLINLSRSPAELQAFEGLMGLKFQLPRCTCSPDCWEKALPVDLSVELLSVFQTWQLHQLVTPKTVEGRSHNVFYDLTLEVMYSHFCHILLASQINPDTL